MSTITIRNVDEHVKQTLRVRAARRGVSMEQEIRSILDAAANEERADAARSESLYEAIRRLVELHGGFDLDLPARQPPRDPPSFS